MVASSVKGETMAEAVDKVAERLARLEVTVAEGFHENSQQFEGVRSELKSVAQHFHEAELRDIALSRKIDVATEALRGDLRNVMDAVTSLGEEMRRTTDSIRKEHAVDRALLTTAIENHAGRLHTLEQKQ